MDNTLENIRQAIKANKPNLSASTIQTYLSSFRKVRRESKIELKSVKDIIDKHKEILEHLQEDTPGARKSKLACLVTILNDPEKKDEEDRAEALKAYRAQMLVDSKIVNEKYDKQELTERQQKNLIDQKEVLKIYERLKAQAQPLFKFDILNKQQFNILQSYVLLSLYVLIPPRRSTDYTFFKIRNYSTEPGTEDNYMFNFNRNKKKNSSFVFNTYKNANRLGRQIIDIPKNLEKIITEWSKFNKSDYLLVNSLGKQVSPSKITLWLNNIFDKSISSSMLRHIFLSDKFGKINLSDLKKTANDMGQGDINTTLAYVEKNSENIVKQNKEEEKNK